MVRKKEGRQKQKLGMEDWVGSDFHPVFSPTAWYNLDECVKFQRIYTNSKIKPIGTVTCLIIRGRNILRLATLKYLEAKCSDSNKTCVYISHCI